MSDRSALALKLCGVICVGITSIYVIYAYVIKSLAPDYHSWRPIQILTALCAAACGFMVARAKGALPDSTIRAILAITAASFGGGAVFFVSLAIIVRNLGA